MDHGDVTVTVCENTQPDQRRTNQQTVADVGLPDRRQTLPHRESHKRLAIVQISIGPLCVILSIVGFIVGYDSHDIPVLNYAGTGIYTGVFYIVAGLLGFLTYRFNSRSMVVACMVVNIIAICVTVVGVSMIGIQLSLLYYSDVFQRVKCGLLILCCAIELITAIVLASFSCATHYECRLPRQSFHGEAARTVCIHPLPQSTAATRMVHQELPQQREDRHGAQQAIHNNAGQQIEENRPHGNFMAAVHIQQEAIHLPYNLT